MKTEIDNLLEKWNFARKSFYSISGELRQLLDPLIYAEGSLTHYSDIRDVYFNGEYLVITCSYYEDSDYYDSDLEKDISIPLSIFSTSDPVNALKEHQLKRKQEEIEKRNVVIAMAAQAERARKLKEYERLKKELGID